MGRGNAQGESTSVGRVHAALLVAQLLSGGYFVVAKVALAHGIHRVVLSVYGDVLAVLILFLAAFIFERHNPLRLSRSVVSKLFLLGLIGIFGSQFLLFIGIERSAAELSSVMQPSVPVFTAVIAILFRVERLNLRRRDSRAKLAGIALCCAGAILMASYRGPPVLGGLGAAIEPHSLRIKLEYPNHFSLFDFGGWELGAVCLIGNCLCIASFINLQASLLKQYPSPISVIAYSYLFGAIILGAASYFLVNDPSAWIVGWNVDLIAILYNVGIISSALYFGLISWALSKLGPLFVASYIPVEHVSFTVLALVFLQTTVYLGSVLGTVLIIFGLLLVSWGYKEAMRLAILSRIVEQSGRVPTVAADARDPELRAPLLQV